MRIPVEIPTGDDLHEAAGFLYLEDDFLVFEYHLLEWGLIKGEPALVKTERGVIGRLRVQRGLFKDRLFIATDNLQLLRAIPGKHASEIELRTKKQHRADVETFVQRVLDWKAQRQPSS